MSEILAERDLSGANTLRLPSTAQRYVALEDLERLPAILRQARERHWPLSVLSGGSNVILAPRLEGLVLQPLFRRVHVRDAAGDEVLVHVEAGMAWHELVTFTVRQGWWGIENLALIPGCCGAAPIQNIGAYGVELADVLDGVEIASLDTGERQWLRRDECSLGYRDSVFKRALAGQVLITGLTLRLSRRARPRLDYGDLAQRVGGSPTPLEVAEAVCAIRREKLPDPAELGNAGSFFKNPAVRDERAGALLEEYPDMPHFPLSDGAVKLAAGWLIDRCGLKGYRRGPFGIHERQALVLVHRGGGDAQGLLGFAEEVAGCVEARFGIRLEREPQVLGRF